MGSKQSYGSLGRTDLHWYDPNDLTIVTEPTHPLYDERANMPPNPKYIASIKQLGVLEPVLCRVNGQDENGKQIVEVMEGRQRTRCTRIANEQLIAEGLTDRVHRVPVILKKVDNKVAEDIMISGNEIRTNDAPLVRARKLQRYLDRGRSIEEAMTTFGIKSQTTVKNLLTLLDLDEEVQKEIEKGVIGVGLAKQLSVFPREQQMAELNKVKAAMGVLPPAAAEPTNGSTNSASTVDTTNGDYNDPAVREALFGPQDPRLTAPDSDEESGAPVPLADHTAPANPPGKRGAKKAAKAALKKQMGKRGAKLRQRAVKTVAQLKEAREALAGSRSEDAATFDAAIAWVLGIEDALSGHKAIANRLEKI